MVHVSTVAARDLRNYTAKILQRVAAGERVTVTVHGEPVADLIPRAAPDRPAYLSRDEVTRLLGETRADPTLAEDIAWISAGTTDDLGPLE